MATNRRELLALTGAVLASLGGCVSAPGDGTGSSGAHGSTEPDVSERRVVPEVAPDALDELVRGNTRFAFDLYETLVETEPAVDHFVSPVSISMALAMTWAGARGDTEDAMAETLHFPFDQDDLHPAFNALDRELADRDDVEVEDGDPLTLNVANALWPRVGFELRGEFLDTLAAHYGARPVELDFADEPEASRRTINAWVADETEDRIPELVPPGMLGPDTPLVLTNAIYFLAGWRDEFEVDNTREAEFTALDGTTGTVSMMSQSNTFPYAEVDGHQLAELPYVGGETSMVVLLPAEGSFESFESSLDAERLDDILAQLAERGGRIDLPRFGIESTYRLRDSLEALGMEEAFGPGANFGGMADGGGLSIAEVVHDAFVSVDEEGTEAAAATAVVMGDGGNTIEFEMTVDRPFLFLIRDRPTGAVLFLGRVVDVPAEP